MGDSSLRRAITLGLGVMLGLAVLGCGSGGDGLDRQPVSGQVTIDGQPLDEGEIAFAPTTGGGPSAGGKISGGSYSIPRADGPVPGPHRVSIYSAKPTGKKVKDETDPNVTYDERAETIPETYNARTTLNADIKAGSNRFDYALEGRKNPAATR
jgi:hypothetical protein